MAGFTRKTLVTIALAVFVAALLLPAAVAGAQEGADACLPYQESCAQGEVVTRDPGDPGDPGQTAAGRLAFTGSSDSVPVVLIAGGLVVFGGALVLVARQRRAHAHADRS